MFSTMVFELSFEIIFTVFRGRITCLDDSLGKLIKPSIFSRLSGFFGGFRHGFISEMPELFNKMLFLPRTIFPGSEMPRTFNKGSERVFNGF